MLKVFLSFSPFTLSIYYALESEVLSLTLYYTNLNWDDEFNQSSSREWVERRGASSKIILQQFP